MHTAYKMYINSEAASIYLFLHTLYILKTNKWISVDSLCGLVVRVPGYRSRGQGSIPGATRFSEK
jgi:hypothetical protein